MSASATQSASATSAASTEAPKKTPASVIRIPVPDDHLAGAVMGLGGAPPRIVFLAGVCANAYAYLYGFVETARRAGGVLAIEGDRPCPSPGFRTISTNAQLQHKRIEAALAAVGAKVDPEEGLTLIGYSRGATIAELLAHQWPERYTRVVLIGSPVAVNAHRMKHVRAAATMSCSRDVPRRMQIGAKQLSKLGVPARYFEMPGCAHGTLAEGERVFGELFTWFTEHQRAPQNRGTATPP